MFSELKDMWTFSPFLAISFALIVANSLIGLTALLLFNCRNLILFVSKF